MRTGVLKSAVLVTLPAMLLAGCSPEKTSPTATSQTSADPASVAALGMPPFKDATGICFRNIRYVDEKGQEQKRYETVLVRQSSSLTKDMERIGLLEESRSFRHPHFEPYVWLGALMDDTRAEIGTDQLDCSGLPVAVETR